MGVSLLYGRILIIFVFLLNKLHQGFPWSSSDDISNSQVNTFR